MNKDLSFPRKGLAVILSLAIGMGPLALPTWASSKKSQINLEQDLKKEKKSPGKKSKKISKKEKSVEEPSFKTPLSSDQLESYSLLNVVYNGNKPALLNLHDQYTLGPIIGDGNCFLHATFTQDGQTTFDMIEFSKKLRASLPQLIIANDQYKNIMRREALAEYRTNFQKYKNLNSLKELYEKLIENNKFERERADARQILTGPISTHLYKKPYNILLDKEKEKVQDQILKQLPQKFKQPIPHSEQELIDSIPDAILAQYVARYTDNGNSSDSYIEIPVFRGEPASIGDVIALSQDILVHCFLYDGESKTLCYKCSLGNPASPHVKSILHDGGNHYWALYNPNDSEARRKGIEQAANNFKTYLQQQTARNFFSTFKGNATSPALVPVSSSSTSQDFLGTDDLFLWQIGHHYKKLAATFEEMSRQQLTQIVQKIKNVIVKHSNYFNAYKENLISNLKDTIYNWLLKDILTYQQFNKEQLNDVDAPESSVVSISEETEEKTDESTEEEEHKKNSKHKKSEEDSEEEAHDFGENLESIENNFIAWQLRTLDTIFGIRVKSLDEFTVKKLEPKHVHKFLTQHVEQGDYSWLINEYMEGIYEASEGFVTHYETELDTDRKLLDAIFGGLWFDYDWARFDIQDPQFVPKTYIQTLNRFVKGQAGKEIKDRTENTIKVLLFYNPSDFNNPFNQLRIDYNKFAKRRDWKNALVVWSVYTTYRKIFTARQLDASIASSPNPLTTIYSFNKESALLKQLKDALQRAQKYYTKVYPHSDTSRVIYSSRKKPESPASLDLKKALSELKFVGQEIEKYRPKETGKQRKNILVPRLYFVISDQPYEKGKSDHKKIFVPIDLDLKLPRKPLTSDADDKVFTGKNIKNYYRQQAQKDYVKGQIAIGLLEEEAKESFKKATERELIHSERVWLQLLRDKKFIDSVIRSLNNKVSEIFPQGYKGNIKVYSALALLYSTNSVCSYCTPSLIAAQNSYDKDGFLFTLIQKLNESKGLKCRGYDDQTKIQNFAKFRMNTIVTATTNFDSQAHDLTEEGQHNHTTIGKKKPPATHNPSGRLIFPNDAIDLHLEPFQEDGSLDPQQRYFYEFVGKNLHKDNKLKSPFSELVLSSGGSGWTVPSGVLKASAKN